MINSFVIEQYQTTIYDVDWPLYFMALYNWIKHIALQKKNDYLGPQNIMSLVKRLF